MKFLIIDDNIGANQNIKDSVSRLGACDSSYDGLDGLCLAESNTYDMIFAEILLPGKNGIEILQELRKKSTCPVIIVSSLDTVEKRVECLRMGADDFVGKPFDSEELVARTEALLRRYNNNFNTRYAYENVELDFASKMVKINGEFVHMSARMYEIVEYLVRNRNTIISKEQLFNRAWGFDSETVITVVEVYMSKLRKILEKYGCKDYLKTVKNVGYMWKER